MMPPRGTYSRQSAAESDERYMIGSENLTLQQILSKLAAITGKPAPSFEVPYALAYAAGVVSTGMASVTGRTPGAARGCQDGSQKDVCCP